MESAGQRRTVATILGASFAGLLLGVASMGVLVASAWAVSGCGDGMSMMMSGEEMSRMMGGGRDSSNEVPRQGSAVETVIIEDFAFSPGNLHVPVGARITWLNRDAAPHSATESGGSWDTGVLSIGERAALTFDTPGTFDYFCTVHATMRARLVVE